MCIIIFCHFSYDRLQEKSFRLYSSSLCIFSADGSYWAQLRARVGVEGPTLDVLNRFLAQRNVGNKSGGIGTRSAPDSKSSPQSSSISDFDDKNSSKKKKKNLMGQSNGKRGPVVPPGNASASKHLRPTVEIKGIAKPPAFGNKKPKKKTPKDAGEKPALPKTPPLDANQATNIAAVSASVVAKVKPKELDNGNACIDENAKHVCNVCNKKFRSERQRDVHLESHGLGYECGVCLKILATETDYAEHRVSQHYVCNIGDCDYYFGSPNGVKFHMQRVHQLEPSYPCHYCDAIFKSSKPHYKHEMQCKAERDAQFKCERCEQTVLEKDRNAHMSTCNVSKEGNVPEPVSETFSCQYCKGDLENGEERDDHEVLCYSNPSRIMTCKLCSKTFVGAMKLGQHLMRTHKQGSSLCIYCHHGFKDAATREKHYESCKARIQCKKEQAEQDYSD